MVGLIDDIVLNKLVTGILKNCSSEPNRNFEGKHIFFVDWSTSCLIILSLTIRLKLHMGKFHSKGKLTFQRLEKAVSIDFSKSFYLSGHATWIWTPYECFMKVQFRSHVQWLARENMTIFESTKLIQHGKRGTHCNIFASIQKFC